MPVTETIFKEDMESLFLLRGWRITHKDRFVAIWHEYNLYKFEMEDLNYAVMRLKYDDSFDERQLMYYMRDSKGKRSPQESYETMAEYEARMAKEIGPNWRELAKRCWEQIGNCCGALDVRADYLENGRAGEAESIDVEAFNRGMARDFPGMGFEN